MPWAVYFSRVSVLDFKKKFFMKCQLKSFFWGGGVSIYYGKLLGISSPASGREAVILSSTSL